MNKISQLALGAALLAPVLIANPANAAVAEGWYVKASVGQTEDAQVGGFAMDGDMAYGAALGTAVGPLRVEAGVDRLDAQANLGFVSVDANALDYHANAYLDLPVGDHASVFVGGGVDYVDAHASIFTNGIDESGYGYNYAAGFAYRISDRMIGELQYRHVEANLDGDIGKVDLEANEITAGFRFAL